MLQYIRDNGLNYDIQKFQEYSANLLNERNDRFHFTSGSVDDKVSKAMRVFRNYEKRLDKPLSDSVRFALNVLEMHSTLSSI